MTQCNEQQLVRQELISTRKNLPSSTIKHSARQLARYIESFQSYKNAKSIATYLPVNGEADPSQIIHSAWLDGKSVYLPVIEGERLLFAPYCSNSKLVTGKYRIPIPEHSPAERLSPKELDLVIVPLVAFDHKLNRVGMGGGFYDKTFSFRQNNTEKPSLIGIAHDLQRVTTIEAQPWDIPMDGVISEKAVYCKSFASS